ncbi:hypothetical protein NLJ89_g9377 [Agrocybe chaxingu]|uniref:CCHC-type domain-containing protein n=1 Tax=Agrocybe chaxingu TaxID=84603 RepID=A0A9W8JTG4_9AGAR|nr:hypothetical protein NLJ89_g9377 [Agrocybe chaxingu]
MTIWNTLTNIHSAGGRSTIIALRRRFHRLRLEHSKTMSAYIARVRHVAFLLTEAKVKISDDDLIIAITSGLLHSYDSFLVALDATPDDNYKLPNVTARLVNEYQHQHMYSTSQRPSAIDPTPDEAMSVAPTSSKLSHITCFTCGNKGHYQANCPTRTSTSVASRPTSAASKPKEYAGLVTPTEDSDSDEAF